MTFLHEIYHGNTALDWAIALLVVLGGTVALVLLRNVVARRLTAFASHNTNRFDDLFVGAIDGTRFVFLFGIALYAGTLVLELPEWVHKNVMRLATVAFIFQAAIWTQRAVTFWIADYVKRKTNDDPASVTTMRAVAFLVRIALWSIVFLLALQNIGVDITALVAGLGVGGIAVALAMQNILSDLFASLSIVLDKPFVQGDFIAVDDFQGAIEYVGLKTTRVRALGGEQIVFSNGDLLKSRIRNYKTQRERRVVFTIGVAYETPADVVATIPAMLREIVGAESPVRVERAHFKGFGQSSLDFEVVYWVLDPDYLKYMDIQQSVNLAIMRRFAERRIAFALPVRTIHVASGSIGVPEPPKRIPARAG